MDALDPDQLGVERFHLVQIVESMQYSHRPEQLMRAVFRALRPGGRAVVIVPHPSPGAMFASGSTTPTTYRRSLGYEIVEGPDGADTITALGSYALTAVGRPDIRPTAAVRHQLSGSRSDRKQAPFLGIGVSEYSICCPAEPPWLRGIARSAPVSARS